jgi:LruC domain-containing protein
MKIKKLYGWVLLAAGLYACQDGSQSPQNTQGEFDYHSTRDISLSPYFTDSKGNYLANIPYEIATSPTFDSTSVLARVSTGNSGVTEIAVNVPTANDSLYVKVNYNGVPTHWKVSVTNGTVNWSNAVVMNEPVTTTKTSGASGGRVTGLPYTVNYLGTFDASGRPNYLEPVGDVIDAGLLSRLNASLPESKSLSVTNPGYITTDDKTIEILDPADVWITFISEGAGYTSTLGFYVYNKTSPPKTTADIKNVTVIFPNCSFPGSGGNLRSGDKVYLGRFQPGQMIGWVIFSNGFQNGNVTGGNWQLYSTQALNSIIPNASLRQQNVLLNDAGFDRVILGFEDIRRDYGSCDNDFNDVLFSITANPYTAINTQPLSDLNTPTDSDGDGVMDQQDAYPKDPARAYNQYFPSQNSFNVLAYEDLWPSRGDYDFNDLVMAYNVQQVLNSKNNVVDVNMTYQLRAVGGSNKIGFAVQMPIAAANLSQYSMTPAYNGDLALNNGAEKDQTKLVFPLFDDAHRVIKPSNGSFTNTVLNEPYVQPVNYSLKVTFANPVSQAELGTAPYNSFIYVNDRSVEVHLPYQLPTDKADKSMLGQSADKSNPAKGIYYLTYDNKPWALLVPGSFDYPAEKQSIESAYNYFTPWAVGKGSVNKDWYNNNTGYRNSSEIFSH